MQRSRETISFPEFLTNVSRLPSLDGWRALSILLVLFSHSSLTFGFPPQLEAFVRWMPSGGFGVQVFFVISGFLITFLLLREHQRSGTISLRGFYQRRILRIVPAYALFLTTIFVLTAVTGLTYDGFQWLRLLTWTTNFFGHMPWPTAHIWSLSVEEQFYFLFPFLFLRAIGNKRALVLIVLVPIMLSPIFRVLEYLRLGKPFVTHYSFFTQADSIAWGCLLAIVCAYHANWIDHWMRLLAKYLPIIAILVIAVPHVLTRLFLVGPLTVPFASSLYSIGIGLLLLHSLKMPNTWYFRPLNTRAAQLVGLWSYSIYLWQQPFCAPFELYGLTNAPRILQFPLWLVPAVLCGVASYYFVERPFLRLKDRASGAAKRSAPDS